MHTIRHIIYILFLGCTMISVSQNLVENPSFESYLECPAQLGNFGEDLTYWSAPTKGTTDYFNTCSLSMGVPQNFMGKQGSKFGNGYVGFYMFAPADYREYVQGELKWPLEKGLNYTLSFYISLAENSDYAIRDFDVLLSAKPLELKIKKALTKYQLSKVKENVVTYIPIEGDRFRTNEDAWVKISATFMAKGGEQFITIGNFKNNAATRRQKLVKERNIKGAYYFLDMVYVGEGIQTFSLNETHVFENVLFNFDEFYIDSKGLREIARVYKYLNLDSNLKIEINGYTDGLGTTAYNKNLSVKRAKAVADQLIKLGMPKDRVLFNGYADMMPIANNKEATGRAQNRRVEFVISKMEIK